MSTALWPAPRRLRRHRSSIPIPIIIAAPGREGSNSVRIVKRGGGTLYWSSTAVYYDAQGSARRGVARRQLAITRKYARLFRCVRNGASSIASSRFKDNESRRRADGPDHGRPARATGDISCSKIRCPRAWKPFRTSRRTRWNVRRATAGGGDHASSIATQEPCSFRRPFEQGRYEFVYLVKAISSGEFRAVPAQMMPMYVPGVTASSEPQTVTVTRPPEGSR